MALEAELVNTTDKGQPMTVAILGLPAGLQPRADQLEELKKAGTIDYYETRAREVILLLAFAWRPNRRVPLQAGSGGRVARQVHRPGEPGVSLLHRRAKTLDRPAGGGDRAGLVHHAQSLGAMPTARRGHVGKLGRSD